jgi:hypothetical protein
MIRLIPIEHITVSAAVKAYNLIKFSAAHFHGNGEQFTGHPIHEEPFNVDVILNVK